MRFLFRSLLRPSLRVWSSSSSFTSTAFSSATNANIRTGVDLLEHFISAAKRNNEMECESLLEEVESQMKSSSSSSSSSFNLNEFLNGTDAFGNSPLMLCSQRDWFESCQKLIDLKCDVNHQNVFGSSALMCGKCTVYICTLIRFILFSIPLFGW